MDDFDLERWLDDNDRILASHERKKPRKPTVRRASKTRASRVSTEEVDRRLQDAYDGRVVRTGEYNGTLSNMSCFCVACGEEMLKKPQHLFLGNWTKCKCNRKSINNGEWTASFDPPIHAA